MPDKIRRPYFIDWAITRRCNLNCLHCRGMTERELSTEEARRVIEGIAALEPGWVIIEGGEPLLHPDIFPLLYYLCSSLNYKGSSIEDT